jgi:hypothetical protein
MSRGSYADVMKEWEILLTAVDVNRTALASLEEFRAGLEEELAGFKESVAKQAMMKAEVQQSTRDLEGFLARGTEMAVRLRGGIRSKYGQRAEKLTEFGMKPLRTRKKPPEPPPEGPPDPPPVVESKPASQEASPTGSAGSAT